MWPSYIILLLSNILIHNILASHGKNNNQQLCKQQSQDPASHCVELEKLIRTDKDKKALLEKINSRRNKVAAGHLRSFPSAENMIKLEWNTQLEVSAQRWANQCIKSSTLNVKDPCRHFEGAEVGQNIATVFGESPGLQPTTLVDMWYMELLNVNGSILPQFTKSSAKGPHYDYFTQLVWADSTEVGCGAVKFKESLESQADRNRTVYRLVCNFLPSGNRENEQVYSLGAPCSKCLGGTCDDTYNALCSKIIITNIKEDTKNSTENSNSEYLEDSSNLHQENITTITQENESSSEFGTEDYTPFDYFSHLHEFTKQTITIPSPKAECQDVLAVDDFIELIKKRLSNDHMFKELLLATKTTQSLPDFNIKDPSVANFIKRIYSKKVFPTTTKNTENEMLNSTLLVDLVEAVIFRNSDKTPVFKIAEQNIYPISDVKPVKIQAELAQVQQNEDFTGHYFFPEDEEGESTTIEVTESYYDAPNLSIADVIMEIEDIKKSTVTKNFLDDILESESATEKTTTLIVLTPYDLSAHKTDQEVMNKFLEDIKEKTDD